jgi:hypothetical protein
VRSCTFILLSLLASGVAPAADTDANLASYLETLEQSGIPPSAAGAVQYLRELRPSGNLRIQVEELLKQLGDDEYARREAAMQQLLRLPHVPVESLEAAAVADDAETRWRARLVLGQSENRSGQVLLAALKTIAALPPVGSAGDIISALPNCRRPYLVDAAHHALRAAAGANDVELLRAKLGDESPSVRIAAALTLSHLLSERGTRELYPLLDDPDDRVALEVARAVANVGDRRCLMTLVRLLDAESLDVRAESASILQSLSGRHLGFVAHESPEQRAVAIEAWRQWVQTDGQTAKLHYPVARNHSGRGDLRGNTLVSTGSLARVMELDSSGDVVWSYAIDAWSAEKLPNGNVLIASYTANKVIEVDAAGEVVWEYSDINAMNAKPLTDGNILIADFGGRRVVEINSKKQIVWQQPTPDECFDADRLSNGNTIFGCPNLVREITPDGKTVREWPIQNRLNGFQALPNGNILVANYGGNQVTELTPDGHTVWQFDEPQPCDAYRLPTGHTLITTATRIIEVAPDKTVVREITKAQYGSARK